MMHETVVDRAFEFAKKKHGKTLDDAGKFYFDAHICKVAMIVEMSTKDKSVVAAAYLHDTIEDTGTTEKELRIEFGSRIADLVMEVTHDGKKDTWGYYFPRLKSLDATLIKFADRLNNLSRMEAWDEKRRDQYLRKSKFWKSSRNDA
jgi:guanosine-3',5'-bis(diphosphate) 3'-pyrophosphohydrolase